MSPRHGSRPRPIAQVLAVGVGTGLVAAGALGLLDALWSWRSAAQFTPGVLTRLRFVLYSGVAHAAAGAAIGLAAGIVVATLRATRLGDLARFAVADHAARRARDPRLALAGLAITIAALPCIAAALVVGFKLALPALATRKAMDLVVVVSMGVAVAAIAAALPVAFVVGRLLEAALQQLPPRAARPLSWIGAPAIAAGGMIAVGLAAWAYRDWQTAQLLPLRGPVVAVLAVAAAVPASRAAARTVDFIAIVTRRTRIALYAALPVALYLVLIVLSSERVLKAATAYTGLAGPITRDLRAPFDWDRDGYARILGGGDCDDSDPEIHPGAAEIPGDGIDQNCIGGDAVVTPRTAADVGFVPVPPSVPKDFDVLLITIDTTRADHLGAYGYARPTSPQIDRLAADGVVFDHGWAHAPSTRYSMPAILTGRLPLDVHYDYSMNWPGLAPDADTIAKELKPLGFVTGAITNYDYFDEFRRMNMGIDEYDNEDKRLHTGVPGKGPEETHGSSSKQQSDKAIAFVDRHAGQRWFLWVHYYDPHASYEPHAEVPSFGTSDVDLYDGEIRFTDLHIGRLLDELRAKGLYDKTVVVLTGDHGEGFGEHDITRHGYNLYAAQTKVPLIVRVPGLPARHSPTPAGHVDIMPTLVDLAGGEAKAEMMGDSLVPELAGPAGDRARTIFQQLSYENQHEMRAAVDERCHVIYNVSPDTSWEAYRVDDDPGETADLTGDDCGDTRSALEVWYDRSTVPAGAADALVATRPAIANPVDAQLGAFAKLLGVDVPARAKPGETIALVWTFEATAAVPDHGWKVFVHLESPAKAMVANGDHAPARPFEWWHAGDLVHYTTKLTIPKTASLGAYTVYVGLFDRDSARAPVSGTTKPVKDDAIAAATIEVAR
jgi:arylsulfatase A-like enzyme|nr:sulfatase-like hydrolase/transferase [Kofleriaceae bacterium]